MQVLKTDKVNCENLIRLLKRAKIELQGAEEILGTAEMLKWISGLSTRIDLVLKEQEEKAKAMEAITSVKVIESMQEKPEKKTKKKGT